MAWVRLDDGFPEHPKVQALDPEAAWLYVQGLCYANRNLTDGFIPLRIAASLGGSRHVRLSKQLTEAGLWQAERGGYRIHDYEDYQPSRESVLSKRESDRNRKGVRPESARTPTAPYPTRPRTQGSIEPSTPRRAGFRPVGEATARLVGALTEEGR